MIFHQQQHQQPLNGFIEVYGGDFNGAAPDRQVADVSDCESGVSGGGGDDSNQASTELFSGSGLIGVGEEERSHSMIKRRLVSGLGSGVAAYLVAVHRSNWSAAPAKATLMAFQIYHRALTQKNSGNANPRYAWFGTSKAGVKKIIAHGFSHEEINRSPGVVYGRGVYLSPDDSPLHSVESAVEDEDGIRHVLLCRVLVGNVELIPQGSNQTHPSSDCFDSGVDNVESPKRYIVWSTNMNTHILPEFVVSFRANVNTLPPPPTVPSSPWMSFPALYGKLANLLPPQSMGLIKNHFHNFVSKRIGRDELVRGIRQVAGDEMLATIIKSCKQN